MNNPNPLIPQGSFLERQTAQQRSMFRTTFFAILAMHLMLLFGLLIQGCNQPIKDPEATEQPSTSAAPAPVASVPPSVPEPAPTVPPSVPAPSVSAPLPQPVAPTPSVTAVPPPPAAPAPVAVAPTPAASTPSSPAKSYVVAKGDTFMKIVRANNLTLRQLLKANPGVDPAKIKVGQTLQIPAPAEKSVQPTSRQPAATSVASSAYVVMPGDTLVKIAKAHATTVAAIRSINQLKTDRLLVGQKLKLPEPAASGVKLKAQAEIPPASEQRI